MQFSSFSKTESGLTITLSNSTPVTNVGSITFYGDNSKGSFSKKEFRWSFNNIYWSSWEPLTQTAITRINTNSNYYLFLQVRYVQTAAGSGSVSTFSINYTLADTSIPTDSQSLTADPCTLYTFDVISRYVTRVVDDASLLNGYPGSYYLSRSHHTGLQGIDTIIGLSSTLNSYAAQYIKSASTGYGLYWVNGYLDVSIYGGSGDVTKAYVDVSLAKRDASIAYLFDNKVNKSGDTMSGPLTINASLGIGRVVSPGFVLDVSGNSRIDGSLYIIGSRLFTGPWKSTTRLGIGALRDVSTVWSDAADVAIGNSALQGETRLGYNTAIGANALAIPLLNVANTAVGYSALMGTGTESQNWYNTAVGYNALAYIDGGQNTGLGAKAGNYVSDGSDNIAIGYNALGGTNWNVKNRNVAIGTDALANTTSSFDGNVALGYQAGYNETGSNKLYISNSNTTSPLIYGDFAQKYITINTSLYVLRIGNLLSPVNPSDAVNKYYVDSSFATNVSVGRAFSSNASLGNVSQLVYALNSSIGSYATNASVNLAFLTNASLGLAGGIGLSRAQADASYATNASVNNAFLTNSSLGYSSLLATALNASIGNYALSSQLNVTDTSLFITKGTYIPEASLNYTYFKWTLGKLDVSGGSGDVTKEYVDGSLATKVDAGSNVGDGSAGVFKQVSGTTMQFRKITGSGAAVVTEGTDVITISLDASFAGEVNTASNVGAGTELYDQKVGSDLQFKTLKSETGNIYFTTDASQVYIDVSDYVSRSYVDGSVASIYSQISKTDTSLYTLYATNVSVGLAFDSNVSLGLAFSEYTNASLGLAFDRFTNVSLGLAFSQYTNVSLGLANNSYATNASVNLALASNASLGLANNIITNTSLGNISQLTYALNTSMGPGLGSYATNTSVNAAISNFSTNASVNNAIASNSSLGNISLLTYALNTSMGPGLGTYVTNTSVNSAIANFASNASVNTALLTNASLGATSALATSGNASIGILTTKLSKTDTSLYSVNILVAALNTSIGPGLGTYATNVSVNLALASNVSLGNISQLTYAHNTSIGWLDSSVKAAFTKNNAQDSSIIRIDASLSDTLEASIYFYVKTQVDASFVYKAGDTITGNLTINSSLNVNGNINGDISTYYYLGRENIDGSWRWYLDVSGNLRFEKRESSIWIFAGCFV